MFLEDSELVALTKRTRSDAQCRVLCFMGIEHKQRPDGSVAVLRAHVEKMFGDGVVSKTRKKSVFDFSQANA